jgi:hypothetical protein
LARQFFIRECILTDSMDSSVSEGSALKLLKTEIASTLELFHKLLLKDPQSDIHPLYLYASVAGLYAPFTDNSLTTINLKRHLHYIVSMALKLNLGPSVALPAKQAKWAQNYEPSILVDACIARSIGLFYCDLLVWGLYKGERFKVGRPTKLSIYLTDKNSSTIGEAGTLKLKASAEVLEKQGISIRAENNSYCIEL